MDSAPIERSHSDQPCRDVKPLVGAMPRKVEHEIVGDRAGLSPDDQPDPFVTMRSGEVGSPAI